MPSAMVLKVWLKNSTSKYLFGVRPILISFEQRRRDMHITFFDRLEERGFDSVRVRSPMLDAAAKAANVFVYRVALRRC